MAIWKGNVALLRGLRITIVANQLVSGMILQVSYKWSYGAPMNGLK